MYNYIEPYVNFFIDGGKLDADMAEAYVLDETTKKLEAFKAKFKEERSNEENK